MDDRRALLLDIDGTLVDNGFWHAVAWTRALRDCGIEVSMHRAHHFVGMGSDHYTRALLGSHHEAATDRHSVRIGELFAEMRPLPGVRRLVEAVRDRGRIVVIATSAGAEDRERLLEIAGIADLVDVTVDNGDVEASKPAPDLIVRALQKCGVTADHAVMVGDTRWDIEAAAAAGVRCIAVESGGWSGNDLSAAGAVEVYPDLGALADALDRSVAG